MSFLFRIPTGWPRHPWRVIGGVILAALSGMSSFPLNAVFACGSLQLLWEL